MFTRCRGPCGLLGTNSCESPVAGGPVTSTSGTGGGGPTCDTICGLGTRAKRPGTRGLHFAPSSLHGGERNPGTDGRHARALSLTYPPPRPRPPEARLSWLHGAYPPSPAPSGPALTSSGAVVLTTRRAVTVTSFHRGGPLLLGPGYIGSHRRARDVPSKVQVTAHHPGQGGDTLLVRVKKGKLHLLLPSPGLDLASLLQVGATGPQSHLPDAPHPQDRDLRLKATPADPSARSSLRSRPTS